MLTFGRMPTLDEVKEYYARDDVLAFIRDASAARDIVISFKEEPSIYSEGETPSLETMDLDELRGYLMERLSRALPEGDYPSERPLPAYPSLHFFTKSAEGEPWDFIMEADCPGWRRSFADVRGAVEILHAYHVPFMVKFSGHRSLHLIIPREAFRDQSIRESWKRIDKDLRQFFSRYALVRRAHGTGGILRLPYSLNENTGMVSLPIHYEDLDAFRPWEAFHHLVEVKEDFRLSHLIQKCKDESAKMSDFLDAALNSRSITPISGRMWSFSPAEKPRYAEMEMKEPAGKAQAAWHNLVTQAGIDNETVRGYRDEENPDVRWFIAESLMGDERAFDLLPESDEYALCAIEDSIAYLASRVSMSDFLDRFLKPDDCHSLRRLQAIMDRLDLKALRNELLHRVEVSDQQEIRQLTRYAYMLGSAFNEWKASEEVIQKARERFPDLIDEAELDVFEAIGQLEARRIHDIREAQRVLMEAGSKAADQIILAMTFSKHWVRRRVIDVILELKDPVFIECLVNALADENGKVRRKAMSALIDLGDAAKTHLGEAVNADNPILRANAIQTLTMIEGKISFGIALKALESTNIKVKSAAVKSLGRINNERAREALKSALWDTASTIGIKAASKLAELGEEGLSILRHALTEAEAQGQTQATRCIAHGLARIGDHSGIHHLIAALYDDSWNEWSTPWLIAQLKHPEGDQALLDFARNCLAEGKFSYKARNVILTLNRVENRVVAPLMREFLPNHEDKKILKAGVDVLRTRAMDLREQESIQALISLVQEDNHSLAQRAASALMKVGKEAIFAVEEAQSKMESGSKPERLLRSVLAQMNKKA